MQMKTSVKLLYKEAHAVLATTPLSAAGALIGSGPGAALSHGSLAERHCLLRAEGGQWFAEDLGSGAGTYVNGERISRRALRHEDVLRCGDLTAQFVEDPPPADPAAEVRRLLALVRQGHDEREVLRRDLDERTKEHHHLRDELGQQTRELDRLQQLLDRTERGHLAAEEEARRLRTEMGQLRCAHEDERRAASLRDAELEAHARALADARARQAEQDAALAECRAETVRQAAAARDEALRMQVLLHQAQEDVRRLGREREQLGARAEALESSESRILAENRSLSQQLDGLRQLLQTATDAMKERGEALASQEARLRAEVRRGAELAQQARGALAARDEAVAYAERLRQERGGPSAPITETMQRLCRQVRDALLELRLEMAAAGAPDAARQGAWQGRLQVLSATLEQLGASLSGQPAG